MMIGDVMRASNFLFCFKVQVGKMLFGERREMRTDNKHFPWVNLDIQQEKYGFDSSICACSKKESIR